MRHILLLLFLVTHYSGAEEVATCDEDSENFIRSNIELSKVSEHDYPLELSKDLKIICKVKNPLMMDGLIFNLYQNLETGYYFIELYNGLDGSSQVYGMFIK